MSNVSEQPSKTRRIESMSDWLLVHGTNARSLRKWVRELRLQSQGLPADLGEDVTQPVISAEAAADLVRSAISQVSPELKAIVDRFDDRIDLLIDLEKTFGDQAYTKYRQEQGRGSLCYIPFDGSLADVILVGHEYTHALQYLASETHMAPIARETCAFLGEFAVMDYLCEQFPDAAASIDQAWEAENQAYLGNDVETLYVALRDRNADYDYRWNYPFARSMAIFLGQSAPDFPLHELLASGDEALSQLPFQFMAENANDANWLPPFQPLENANSNLSAYQQIGALAMLDSQYMIGACEKPISEYWQDLMEPFGKGQAFLQTDGYGRPLGYATWSEGNNGQIEIQRQCAPFGDQAKLFAGLGNHFQGQSVVSVHPTAAEGEQAPW